MFDISVGLTLVYVWRFTY